MGKQFPGRKSNDRWGGMRIEFTPGALRQLEAFRRFPKLSVRLRYALEQIQLHPYNAKPLEGEFEDAFAFRVGEYRIIYRIIENRLIILVVRIGHRREVYR